MDLTAADRFVIEGGHPIGGEVIPSGNKNEALPLLAASLLASGNVVIENVPRIRDVTTLIELVRALGVSVDWSGEHAVTVDAGGLRESRPDAGLAAEIRASFLLAAPLLARTGLAVLPRPGGRDDRRRASRARGGARPSPDDPARAGPARHRDLRGGHEPSGARGAEADHRSRRRRRNRQGRRRPVARLPGRPDAAGARARDAVRGHRADPRKALREPALLRRQPDRDGRAHPPQRPAPRARDRPEPSARRDHRLARHPRRYGPDRGGAHGAGPLGHS